MLAVTKTVIFSKVKIQLLVYYVCMDDVYNVLGGKTKIAMQKNMPRRICPNREDMTYHEYYENGNQMKS